MVEHGGYEFTAAADYFPSQLESFSKGFKVPGNRLYSGLAGYEKLLQDPNVDAVAIFTPPYFHPEHARAAVEAGKHVYVAKPVAVDVPGCRTIEETGALATKNGLSFLVDFQTRADKHYREGVRRVHDGAIGALSFGEASYHTSDVFVETWQCLLKDPRNPENRLRAWGVDRILSGGSLTEQNVHTIDVASWILDMPPVAAAGNCNRNVRRLGDSSDHYSVIFKYPGEVDVSLTSRQFKGHGTKPEGIRNRMFGAEGVLECHYGGMVVVRARDFYKGSSPGLYRDGAVANVATFHRMIAGGDASSATVAPSVRSNLVTILGRTAAYTGKVATWEEVLKSEEKWVTDLDLKA